MANILSLSEWFEFIKEFLLDEEKVTPFTEGLEYIFSNLNITDILSNYELNRIINKNQFIDFIINYIDNHLLYLNDYNYLSNILKYFLEFFRNNDDLDDFDNLKYYLYEYQLNDFTFLIKKYNEWLDCKHYAENFTFREPILVEDHIYLLENWIEWFNIRYRMNNVFINNTYIDWYIFSNYLHTI
jgi:hypothetical protein